MTTDLKAALAEYSTLENTTYHWSAIEERMLGELRTAVELLGRAREALEADREWFEVYMKPDDWEKQKATLIALQAHGITGKENPHG